VRWHADPLPDFTGPLYQDPSWAEMERKTSQKENFGFTKTEELSGSITYLEIRKFARLKWGWEAAVDALNSAVNPAALILDLCRCKGGHADMVAFLASHLFPEKPIHLFSIYWRDEDRVQEFWSEPAIPGPRFDKVPVYLLISRETFSAGEQFASLLKSHQRAIIIGETTGGGAHLGASYRLSPHFELFLPIGRGFDPITGLDWEGTGISAHVRTDPEQSLQTACKMAMRAIGGEHPS
jgi:C-terminal processing protease CtpA/Prc